MKTNNFLKSGFLLLLCALAYSCEKFLDITPVEQLTFDKIWEKREPSERYLATIYGYMPNHYDASGNEQAIFGVTDESSMSWPNYKNGPGKIADGTWSPTSISLGGGTDGGHKTNNPWIIYYRGIREATIFINNIDRVNEIEINAGRKAAYKVEARFLRAFYYYQLMKFFGSVVLIGEDILSPSSSQAELSLPRNSWDECLKYVADEMNYCAANLPDVQPTTELGRPTKGAALAVLSRLRLYAARPLFNGNPLYVNIANKDGKKLFPQSYDNEKWKVAADAAKAVIDLGIYELYKEGTDPYKSYAGVFFKRWNTEVILGRNAGSTNQAQHCTPRGGVEGWGAAYGGWSPTQQQVDAYAMASGRYPITGYSSTGQPSIDPAANYQDGLNEAFVSFTHPFDNISVTAPKMYQNREPRFYVTVFWNNQKWYQSNGREVTFHTGGNSGPPEQDHARTGYINRKFCSPNNQPKEGVFETFSWPYIRLAEIYLNYVEALNEYYGPNHADIKLYLNKIRERAGVPALETVYPEAFASKESLREYILKERRLELAFEGHRYFDTRTWMMKVNGIPVDAGNMWGMNIAATSSVAGGDFWKRISTETRIFKDAYYLIPISQNELNKNHNLVQNYGW